MKLPKFSEKNKKITSNADMVKITGGGYPYKLKEEIEYKQTKTVCRECI